MEQETLKAISSGDLGATIIIAFGLLELVKYLISKFVTMKNGSNSVSNAEVLSELKLMNTNHLNHIEKAITDGNTNLINAIHNGNDKVVHAIQEMHIDLVKELNNSNNRK